jgi:hypothetical protein
MVGAGLPASRAVPSGGRGVRLGDMQRSDVIRQAGVLVLALLATLGATIGSGAFGGTPIAEAADGALSASATPVAPGSPAFSIWSVIYTGLLAYAVWQALPGRRNDSRQRRLGWLAAGSMLLNAGWIGVVQLGVLWLSVAVIVALLAVLVRILLICLAVPARSRVEALLVDGTFGLYLGWVTIATIANTAAAVKESDVGELGLGPTGWSIVLLVAAAVIGVAYAVATGGRLAVALALAWGLAWVAIARWTDEPRDGAVAVTAAVGSAVTLASALAVRLRGRHALSPRRDVRRRRRTDGPRGPAGRARPRPGRSCRRRRRTARSGWRSPLPACTPAAGRRPARSGRTRRG